jgi:hypothetical protein
MSEVAEAVRETLLVIAENRRKEAVQKGHWLEAVLASVAKGWLIEIRKDTSKW